MLSGRVIVVGVTGGIAAYKVGELVSALTRGGASVDVIMTAAAQQFVRPLTFSALTGNPVYTDAFVPGPHGPVPHIRLAERADLFVVAPATANILAKLAHGLADDLLSTTLLAVTCPVVICPAMNVRMYAHPVVQANLHRLKELGYYILEPEEGRLACGTRGRGRLAEPRVILNYITELLTSCGDLTGLAVLVTAGGTREPLDPVRYISNRSSGKMGYALANAAARRGAAVTLVSAPTSLTPPPGVELISIETAQEMYRAVMERFPKTDVVIKAAAVADYRPKVVAGQKIKKSGESLILELEKNPDILYELGQKKSSHQILVGFAAETENVEENGRQKMKKKNLDLLAANDVTQPGAGFGAETNIVKLFYPDGRILSLPRMDKLALAHKILDVVLELRQNLQKNASRVLRSEPGK